jgi:uncharacterized membrane protein YphA (DoxX/SURF4 family)
MKARSIAYWITTVLVALPIGSGGIVQVLRLPQNAAGFAHLGYPVYFMVILGVWKVLGAIVILVPGLTRLKEWATASMCSA